MQLIALCSQLLWMPVVATVWFCIRCPKDTRVLCDPSEIPCKLGTVEELLASKTITLETRKEGFFFNVAIKREAVIREQNTKLIHFLS